MKNKTPQEQRGWVLLLVGNERHYFFGKTSACGLHFVPAIAETDYESRNDGRVPNCWMCEEALEMIEQSTTQTKRQKRLANHSFCGTGRR